MLIMFRDTSPPEVKEKEKVVKKKVKKKTSTGSQSVETSKKKK